MTDKINAYKAGRMAVGAKKVVENRAFDLRKALMEYGVDFGGASLSDIEK